MERRPFCRGRSLREGVSAGDSADLVDWIGIGGGDGSIGLAEDRAFVTPQSISISPRPKPMSNDSGCGRRGLERSTLLVALGVVGDLPLREPIDLRLLRVFPTVDVGADSIAGEGGWEVDLDDLSLPKIPREGFRLLCCVIERAPSVL
jgi:hypothetical protein